MSRFVGEEREEGLGREGARQKLTRKNLDYFFSLSVPHRNSMEDLKREHEEDKHHLINMHRQEMEAIKAAHSHTRYLCYSV